ncbi:MAG TPA: hypothetical protein VMJ30_07720 [Gemmatimonadales bacterium]|nr:hypothetical protein [Gemmatimonadales bacterium]
MTVVLAGAVAGVVHVLSGPDHLAAIAPYAVADRARSWTTGVRWGLGHSTGVLVVGFLLLVARQAVPIEALSAHGEVAVGFALIGIGLWGVRSARRGIGHSHWYDHTGHRRGRAAVAVGTLHGLAGSSHLLGILPALALPSDAAATAYLLCFATGSVAAMGTFASCVGWVAGRGLAGGPEVHRMLLGVCSGFAVLVGGWWVVSSLPGALTSWLLH